MEAGDIVTVDGVKCVVRCIASLVSFCDTTGKMPYLIAALDKIEEPKPDIRWERIPKPYNTFTVNEIGDLHFPTADCDNQWHYMGAAWADMLFSNRKDFIGRTFERPKGGDA